MDHNRSSQLLEAYINICNEALEKNKDNFPFSQMWTALKNQCQDQNINVALIDDKPQALCSLSFSENGIALSDTKQDKTHKDCHIKLSHIKHVLGNKDTYINDPALIDWHWIEAMIENYKSSQG